MVPVRSGPNAGKVWSIKLCFLLPKNRRCQTAGFPLLVDGTRSVPVAFFRPSPRKLFAVPAWSTADQRQTAVDSHRPTLRKLLTALPIYICVAPTRWEPPVFPVFPRGCFRVIFSYRRRQVHQSWWKMARKRANRLISGKIGNRPPIGTVFGSRRFCGHGWNTDGTRTRRIGRLDLDHTVMDQGRKEDSPAHRPSW